MTVGNVMRDHDLPVVAPDCPATEMIHAISKGGLGLIVICEGDRIEGIVTDGDVRRAMERLRGEFFNIKAADIATPHPKTIAPTEQAIEAEKMMTRNKVTSLLVTDEGGQTHRRDPDLRHQALSLRSRTDTQKRNPIVGFLFFMREADGSFALFELENGLDVFSNCRAIFRARTVDGTNFPASMALIVWRLTPTASANCCWVMRRSARSTRILFFMCGLLSESPQHDPFDDEEEHGQQA